MPKKTRYVFSRVPGYDTFTGDRRVWTTPQRHDFVCFVIDLETMKGEGIRYETLPAAKLAADYYAQHLSFPAKVLGKTLQEGQ